LKKTVTKALELTDGEEKVNCSKKFWLIDYLRGLPRTTNAGVDKHQASDITYQKNLNFEAIVELNRTRRVLDQLDKVKRAATAPPSSQACLIS
jgi:hypothetical protein